MRARLAPLGSRSHCLGRGIAALTLCQLEDRFRSVLPRRWFAKGPKQRDRLYTTARVFWCFLWQVLHPGSSCREVVRQLQALFGLHGGPRICPDNGAYCQARGRLDGKLIEKALQATAHAAQQSAPASDPTFLQGRALKLVDATTVAMPDSPQNRAAYPIVQTPDSIGFPMLRLVVLFCWTSGAVLARLTGNLLQGELRLFQALLGQLRNKDIVVGDRGYGYFIVLYFLQGLGVDFIGRTTRKIDGRKRRQRLGHKDWLMDWTRPQKPSALLTPKQWKKVPKLLQVRIVVGSLYRPGFRVRQVTVVTTLLDPLAYPAPQILQAYLQRWRLELCFDDLKTTLQMSMLSCQSPPMIGKELDLHLVAHNLIRLVAAQAASHHGVALHSISFKGTLDGLRHFCQAMCGTRGKRQRRLWQELLSTLVADRLVARPNRREPRAVKKQKNKYDRLNRPRHLFRDPPKSYRSRPKSKAAAN